MIGEILFDAFKDSVLVFGFVLLIHILLSFVETRLSSFLIKRKRTGPLFGSIFGLIPQCGTSVLGADLYIRRYISIGTLIAIFLSCSDEAFIAILASGKSEKMVMVVPLLGLKFLIGFVIGIISDLIFRKDNMNKEPTHIEDESCHNHHHEKMDKHLLHPLIHALEIFGYVLVINIALGLIIGFVGEDNFINFVNSNKYLSPLFASIIGLIPNCASSLLLSELFLENSLSFGALLSGLLVNAGLGLTVLLRNRKGAKNIIWIILICFITAVAAGYITCLIMGF